MIFNELKIDGTYLIELSPMEDNRGFFARGFCQKEFSQIRENIVIEQINQSLTKEKGSIRGMHFQYPPHAEMKIIRCIKGKVFDVVVDLRKNSKTFLSWHGEVLSAENWRSLVIPEGCAHGFQTLEENCEMLYLHTKSYCKDSEGAVKFDDPKIGIEWRLPVTFVSERDKNHKLLDNKFEGIEL